QTQAQFPRQADNIGRSRRSVTVPSRGSALHETDSRFTNPDNAQSPRLSNPSKDGSGHRNASVASRESSETQPTDDVMRLDSSAPALDGEIGTPPLQGQGIVDITEERENEDALYIHGKDGKKRKVPITGFAVQSGK